jgi:rubredoxin
MQAPAARDGRRECRICWYVYDPEDGDPVWQIEPGTPFEALPQHWSCPHCAAERSQFLAVES